MPWDLIAAAAVGFAIIYLVLVFSDFTDDAD
jgi:hypothetical protein